jgi:hypothetical protein
MVSDAPAGRWARRHGRASVAAQRSGAPAWAWRCLLLIPVGVASGAAGLGFHRIFGYLPLIKPVCAATVVPLLLAAAQSLAGRKLPMPVSHILSACVWLVLACVMMFPAGHGFPVTASRLAMIGDGLVNGWAQLLNITLPVPTRPELAVVPFALTWLAASVGAELVLRTARTLAPLVTSLLVLTAGIALSAPVRGPDLPEASVLTASALALALLRNVQATGASRAGSSPGARRSQPPVSPTGRQHCGGHGRPGRLALTGLLAVLAVTAVGVLAGPLSIPHRRPVDPRRYWPAPVQQVWVANPLDQVAGWLARPRQFLFQVQSPVGADWQLAVLDTFDGQQWTSPAQFSPAGRGVPGLAQSAHGQVVRQRFRIRRLGGSLLPAAYQPVALAATGLSVDTDTGMLLTARPLHAGITYSVASELVPGLQPDQLARLAPAAPPSSNPDLTVPPGAPAALYALARIATRMGAAGSAFQQAASLERYLRKRFVNDPKGRAGYAYGDLARFLTTRRGTSVQFAATFALAARLLGLPSRLVVGFTPGTAGHGGMVYRVRAGDALVWPEADFAGAGWIPFFPTPPPRSQSKAWLQAVPEGETAARAHIGSQALRLRPDPDPFTPVMTPRPTAVTARSASHVVLVRWVLVAVGAALTCCFIAIPLLVPFRRHRRRTRGSPQTRIIGAWHDLLEQLADMGMPPSPGAANSAVARTGIRAAGQDVTAELSSLAVLVNRAMFAWTEATDRQAVRAWRYRDASRAALRNATPLRYRLRARLRARSARSGSGSASPPERG